MLQDIPPFKEFEPVLWTPTEKTSGDYRGSVYSTMRQHGVRGEVILHNLSDSINSRKSLTNKVIVEYRIKGQSYPLFSVRDFFEATHSFSEEGRGNILGDIAERISRRVVKYFLKHHSSHGDTGGIFDKRFNPKDKNGYIVTNSENYLLKIQKYPNLIILRKSGETAWEYENIKELDGFFDYRFHKKRHLIVLESKLDKVNINLDKVIQNLFEPLRELFPDVSLHYALFSNRNSIFEGDSKYNILRSRPSATYQILKKHGIGSLFFAFNESHREFNSIATHLITQYKRIAHMRVEIDGKIILDHNSVELFDKGEGPFMRFVRDRETGFWKER
jgi:hypothetical protein